MSTRTAQRLRIRWKQQIRDGLVINCALCGNTISLNGNKSNKGSISVDHIIPRSKGGSDRVANLQPTHNSCNWSKGNKTTLAE